MPIYDFDDHSAGSEQRAHEFADLYGIVPSPTVVRLLRAGPDAKRHKVARHILIGARLAAGETLEALQAEGWVTDDDLRDLEQEQPA